MPNDGKILPLAFSNPTARSIFKLLDSPLTLFLIALAGRLTIVAMGIKGAEDDGVFRNAATEFVQGQGLSYPHFLPYSGVRFYAWLPPGFPLLLAAYYKLAGIGADLLPVRLFITFFGAMACVWVYRLGHVLAGRHVGLVAGYWLALYPPHILDSTVLTSHPLPNDFVILVVLLVVTARQNVSKHRLFWAGCLLALGTLFRSETFSLCLPILAWILLVAGKRDDTETCRFDLRSAVRRGLPQCGVFMVGFAVVMSPWVIHNWVRLNRFVLLTTNYGDNFYFAHNPAYKFGGEANYYDPERLIRLAQGLNEVEIADMMVQEGVRYIREKPMAFVGRVVGNFLHFWKPFISPQKYSAWEITVYMASYLPLFIFFVIGLFRVPWRDESGWWLIGSIILIKNLAQLLFYVIVRFREALTPFMVLFAAYALLLTLQRFAARKAASPQ